MLNNYAVVGQPIAHSLSPIIHQCFAEQTNISLRYIKIKGDEQLFEKQVCDFFKVQGKGLNITLPFKQRAYDLAQVHTERCFKAGAANTLWYSENQIHADNTDGIGLVRDLSKHSTIANSKVLILGAGGAARGIVQPLWLEKPKQLVVANRSIQALKLIKEIAPEIDTVSLNQLEGTYDVIINATSAGLYGEQINIPPNIIAKNTFCYDLTYQLKGTTTFLSYTHQLGAQGIDGLGMLVEQAAESFYIWHGTRPNTSKVLSYLRLNS